MFKILAMIKRRIIIDYPRLKAFVDRFRIKLIKLLMGSCKIFYTLRIFLGEMVNEGFVEQIKQFIVWAVRLFLGFQKRDRAIGSIGNDQTIDLRLNARRGAGAGKKTWQ